jgi:hypothetical protein
MILWFDKETDRIILTTNEDHDKITLSLEDAQDLQEQLDRLLMRIDTDNRPRHLNGIF